MSQQPASGSRRPYPQSERSHVRQRLAAALVSVVAIAVSTAAVLSLTGGTSPSRTPDDGLRTSPSGSEAGRSQERTRTRDLRLGLAYGDTLTWATDTELTTAMDDAEELGIRWLRVDLSWTNIQPDYPTQYLWERFDRVVDAARDHDLEVLTTISYTPKWARDPVCADTNQSCPPADHGKFAEFARLAAERYAPKGVHTWEIWNEPNIQMFWKSGPSAERYTQLLTATAQAIRSTDPKAYLLLGGLAAVNTIPSRQYLSHKTFLEQLAQEGALKQVDAVAYHPYTYPLLPSTETATGTRFQDIDRTHDSLVSILERHGAPDMPIWLTETGAPTWSPGTAADSEEAQGTAHVTRRLQSEIAADTVNASAAIPSVEAVCWYAYRDAGPEGSDIRKSRHYGLTLSDGTRKPAFEAFKKAISDYRQQN